MTQQDVMQLRKTYTKGTRIKLIRMIDVQAPPQGTEGTVVGVDDAGHILMKWDNHSSLNLIVEQDVFQILD